MNAVEQSSFSSLRLLSLVPSDQTQRFTDPTHHCGGTASLSSLIDQKDVVKILQESLVTTRRHRYLGVDEEESGRLTSPNHIYILAD